MLAVRPRLHRRAALVTVGLAALAAWAASSGRTAHAAATPRPIVYVNSFATYSVRPDGTGWQRLNECFFNPIATNGRLLIGGFSHIPDREVPLVVLPAGREVVNDCDNGPRDPSLLRYRLRVRGSQIRSWTSFAWSPDARRVLGVGQVGSRSAARSSIAVFNANGSGFRLLATTSLDGSSSNVTDAAWSSRGDRIVFGRVFQSGDCPEYVETRTVAIGCDRVELAVMDADGSNARSLYRPVQIDPSAADDLPEGSALRTLPSVRFHPFAWHGGKIFMTAHDQLSTDASDRIAVINEDGTGFRYPTRKGSNLVRPALSPDGRQIAFIWTPGPNCNRAGNVCGKPTALYVMSSGGGVPRKVQIRQPLTSVTCDRGSGRKTCTSTNIGFSHVAW